MFAKVTGSDGSVNVLEPVDFRWATPTVVPKVATPSSCVFALTTPFHQTTPIHLKLEPKPLVFRSYLKPPLTPNTALPSCGISELGLISITETCNTDKNGDSAYRSGQKGSIVEFFGWPHADIEQECAFLADAG